MLQIFAMCRRIARADSEMFADVWKKSCALIFRRWADTALIFADVKEDIVEQLLVESACLFSFCIRSSFLMS